MTADSPGAKPVKEGRGLASIAQLFADTKKAVTRRVDDSPQPSKQKEKQRGRGETGKTFRMAATKSATNARRLMGVAFKQARSAAQNPSFSVRKAAYDSATVFLSDTLDYFWFHHWHNETGADAGNNSADDCATTNHLSPHL
jgi:hypothetical protein